MGSDIKRLQDLINSLEQLKEEEAQKESENIVSENTVVTEEQNQNVTNTTNTTNNKGILNSIFE